MLAIIIIILTSGVVLKLDFSYQKLFYIQWLHGELSHHPERRCLLFMLPGARPSAVTDFGQKQASCLFHGLAFNLCQDFQENRKRICSIYETKALSEFPGLVCHMEMSCSVALSPWFRLQGSGSGHCYFHILKLGEDSLVSLFSL